MIKVELQNSKVILEMHYKNLTEKKGRKWTIIDFLNKRIEYVSGNKDLEDMYEYLKTKVKKNKQGYSILTALPKELQLFKEKFEEDYGALLDLSYGKTEDPDYTYRDDLLKVFYYSSYDKWNPYELAKKIAINVCPYCNRSYTFLLGNDLKKGTRFEFDHFFDKATYPYLALSLYNLVPSCHVCNSNLKGSSIFNLGDNIHPFIEGFSEDILFSIAPKNIDFVNGKSSAYRVKFKKNELSTWDNKKIKAAIRNISTFKLSGLYNMHKDYINEIIQKSQIYNDDYIKDLFKKYEGTLFSSEDDVRRMVLGNYLHETDFSKRPLSKLTRDIARELKIM
ncbi:hypothetical protein [Chryseobacterium sp. T20]|uniref:hypothetical protein n=1 Tax=Chryseobacterium sp. T20 TaxID=3395375 RepID=UPI0039BC8DEF